MSATSIALETTKRNLEEIARWSELSRYLKHIHRVDAEESRRDAATFEERKRRQQARSDYYYLSRMSFAEMVAAKIIVPNGKYRRNKKGELEPVYVRNPEFLEQPQPSSLKQEFRRGARPQKLFRFCTRQYRMAPRAA